MTAPGKTPSYIADSEAAVVAGAAVPERRSLHVWQRKYRRRLVAVDFVVILLSTLTAQHVRFGQSHGASFNGLSYAVFSVALVPLWVAALLLARAYQTRYLGTGAEEFRRVSAGSLRLLASVAVVAYIFELQLARGYVAVALPLGTLLLLIGRYAVRRWLHIQRRHGLFLHRVLAVGGATDIGDLADQLTREPYAGFMVVGACLPGLSGESMVAGIPVLGSLTQVTEAVRESGADTVAITSGSSMSSAVLRRLSWELEGTGVDLVVAPALTDFAGPRINIRPVAGLPLLYVEEPELSGFRQWVKAAAERAFAALACLLLAPLLAALALWVRTDSPGNALFRQTRVGKHGREFTLYKLRTMRADAESRIESLRQLNDRADGLLFKMRQDPRVTRAGAWLRRWSLDELPQLFNVVRGEMAIIGPRPPLPAEVAQYGSEAARRLLVRPGITGLWQVSGRSDLSWDDSVRLDLYYVENWSLALDLLIVWKTLFAVLRRDGAY